MRQPGRQARARCAWRAGFRLLDGAAAVFDPGRYRVVLFDQRGCGRSTPHAGDPATDLSVNTTGHLLGSVTTTRRSETRWLYHGVGRFFPEAWERFRSGVPEVDRNGDVVAAYARLVESPDPEIRERAVAGWCAWEDAVISLEFNGSPGAYGRRPLAAQRAHARICAHYFSHGAWLEEGALLRDAGRLAGIPGVLIHGRHDLGGPVRTAWQLARAWPGAELIVVDEAGHMGSKTTSRHLMAAFERFART